MRSGEISCAVVIHEVPVVNHECAVVVHGCPVVKHECEVVSHEWPVVVQRCLKCIPQSVDDEEALPDGGLGMIRI